MAASTASEFVAEMRADPELQEDLETKGVQAVIEERGHEFTPDEVESAIRDIILETELPNADDEQVESIKALYTVTHVCTCKCTISC